MLDARRIIVKHIFWLRIILCPVEHKNKYMYFRFNKLNIRIMLSFQ